MTVVKVMGECGMNFTSLVMLDSKRVEWLDEDDQNWTTMTSCKTSKTRKTRMLRPLQQQTATVMNQPPLVKELAV